MVATEKERCLRLPADETRDSTGVGRIWDLHLKGARIAGVKC